MNQPSTTIFKALKIKIYSFIILIFLIGTHSIAQDNSTFQYNPAEKIYPQSPQANAFEKFTSIPPGNFTGVHGFSVPIYTFQSSEFNFPISIDYHGGGIKVDEISGEVGLGWGLNIGGVSLSQEVRDRNDNFSHKVSIHDPDDFLSKISPQQENYAIALQMAGGSQSPNNLDQGHEYNPDFYSYSLLNNSGKFIFDKDTIPHTIPKDAVQVLNGGTVLIDDNGIRYEFIRYTNAINRYGANNGNIPFTNSTAYRINKIIFPKGDVMNFNYREITYSYISDFSASRRIFGQNSNYMMSFCEFPFDGDNVYNTVFTTATEHLIESIEFNQTIVKFSYLTDSHNNIISREDINGAAKLIKIEVYFKPTSGLPQIRKEYTLNSSYFISPQESTLVPNSNEFPVSNLFRRLRLDSIEEKFSKQNYSFEYYDSIPLPHRFSYSVDHWGVFNGENNESPFPHYLYEDYDGETRLLTEGYKYPNLDFAKMGVLKKVYFPTGGSQEFEYELDEYRIYKDPEFCDDPGTTNVIEYCEDEVENRFLPADYEFSHEFWFNQYPNNGYTIPINPYNDGFDFRDGFDYTFQFLTNYPPLCDEGGYGQPMEDEPYFKIQIIEEGNPIPLQEITCNPATVKLPALDISKNYYLKILKQGAGGVDWEYYNGFIKMDFKLMWAQNDMHLIKNKKAGSLRTKTITLTNPDGSPQIKQSFEYNHFKHPQYSGGVLGSRRVNSIYKKTEPSDFVIPPSQNNECPDYAGMCNYIVLSSSPAYNINNSFGKSVYYENVKVIFEDLNNNDNSYKKELEFSEFPLNYNELNPNITTPIPYIAHYAYATGKLLEERFYNNNGIIVKKIKNDPSEFDNYFNTFSEDYQGNYYISFGVGLSIEEIKRFNHTPCLYEYYMNSYFYNIPSAWIKHKKTTEETYENGVLKMSNTTTYQYSPTYKHLNPIAIIKTNSLGETLSTEYQYPQDLTSGYEQSSLMQEMENRNMISTPVKTVTKHNGTVISEQRTLYDIYPGQNNTEIILPEYVYAKKGTGTTSADKKITYDKYDENGNLQQYTLADGTPVSIVWGYNKQYPIAKVEGVAYTTIASQAGTLAGLSDTGSLIETSFETLRNTSEALVTCYIYEPLVGVTIIIQPNGQKEVYEYDNAGRLQQVKDQNGKVLKKIDYNYQH